MVQYTYMAATQVTVYDRDMVDRGRIIAEYAGYLAKAYPRWRFSLVGSESMTVHLPSEVAVEVSLRPLLEDAEHLSELGAHERVRIYGRYAHALAHKVMTGSITLGRDEPQMFARIDLTSRIAEHADRIPNTPLGDTALSLVLVFLWPEVPGIVFMSRDSLRQLGLTFEQAREVSLRNLAAATDTTSIRAALDTKGGARLEASDLLCASRLLLIPELLRRQEQIAALVPYRDLLLLNSLSSPDVLPTPDIPLNGNPDEVLCDQWLLVTATGITVLNS